MTLNNQINKVKEEYFEFCLMLLQKIPMEEVSEKKSASRAYSLKEKLNAALIENDRNFYDDFLKTMQSEIDKLRMELDNKFKDT